MKYSMNLYSRIEKVTMIAGSGVEIEVSLMAAIDR
jgi:hypothetical protein